MNIKISALYVPRIARNKRIYQGEQTAVTTLVNPGSTSGGSTGGSHPRLHALNSPADHSPAAAADYGKYLHANATTGEAEWAALVQLLKRVGTVLSPTTAGDSIDAATGYLIGALKATKILAKTNGVTAIQITKADGTTVVMNFDTTNDMAKLNGWLAIAAGGSGIDAKSPLDVTGSVGMNGRIVKAIAGGSTINMQDTESIYLFNCTLGNITFNLQAASSVPRRICHIKYLAGGNNLLITPSGTDAIYSNVGLATPVTVNTPGHWITIQSYLTSGTTWDWYIISAYPIR